MGEVTIGQVPEFITFLFSRKPKFDCYFIVGNKDMGEPERIGGIKLMLMAHSDVFRCELEDSEIAEKDEIKVKDAQPETFKSMLKYVYGHDTTSEMPFAEADNLLYLAEKYMIKRLKDRVAMRLKCLLTPHNICSLLNNPVCYTHLELDTAITKILQYETDKVLASTEFLSLNPEGFLKILKQDGLAVYEIELWRAAVKWAKHRAGDENGVVLRKHISVAEKHIRVCTLDLNQFWQEVVPSDILSPEELGLVCKSISTKEKQGSLTTLCNEVEFRRRLFKTETIMKSLDVWNSKMGNGIESNNPTCSYEVVTKQYPVRLEEWHFKAIDRKRTQPEGWTYQVQCVVTIRKVPNPYNQDGSSETDHDNSPMVSRSDSFVELGKWFFIPITIDGEYVTLLPFNKYSITLSFTGRIKNFKINPGHMILENEDLLVAFASSYIPVRMFHYSMVKPVLSSETSGNNC